MGAEIYWRNSSVWQLPQRNRWTRSATVTRLIQSHCTHRGRHHPSHEASITWPNNPALNIWFPSSSLLRHGAQTGRRQRSWKTNKHSPGWSMSCSLPLYNGSQCHNGGPLLSFSQKKFPWLTTHSGWQLCSYLANVSIAGPGTEKGNTNYGLQFGGGLLK